MIDFGVAGMRRVAHSSEAIFIPRSYGNFFLTPKSLQSFLNRNFFTFNMALRRLQLFHSFLYALF